MTSTNKTPPQSTPNRDPAEVVSANVEFYRQISAAYDQYESCAFDPMFQAMLKHDLEIIAGQLGRFPSCLDCGGGTGNIALKLLERGWPVTVVDVSPSMLAILEQKLASRGFRATLINQPLEAYLNNEEARDFDLITFGSVLHHLHSYFDVLGKAVQRLRPGGVLYSNFDPVTPGNAFLAGAYGSLDTLCAKLLLHRADVLPGIGRRLKKLILPRSGDGRVVASAGDLAEYHARAGLDDRAVVSFLCSRGLTVLHHTRYEYGRTPWTRKLNQKLKLTQCFRLICRRPGDASPEVREHGSRPAP